MPLCTFNIIEPRVKFTIYLNLQIKNGHASLLEIFLNIMFVSSSGYGWRKGLPLWEVAANILNKQSQKPAMGGPPALVLGDVLTTPYRQILTCYGIFHETSDLDWSFGTTQEDSGSGRGNKLEGPLTLHLPHEIKWNANLLQQGNFIDVCLARHVSGTYAYHQEH